MPWIFAPLEIPDGTTKAEPAEAEIRETLGQLRGVAVMLPGTTAGHDAGLRVLGGSNNPIFPRRNEVGEGWLHAQTFDIHEVLEEEQSIAQRSPVRIKVQGYNTSGGAIKVQVGLYLSPWADGADRIVGKLRDLGEAMKRTGAMPDIERQIRRVVELTMHVIRPEEPEEDGQP